MLSFSRVSNAICDTKDYCRIVCLQCVTPSRVTARKYAQPNGQLIRNHRPYLWINRKNDNYKLSSY